MPDLNPYAPPKAAVADVAGSENQLADAPLASRGRRFVGSLIDSLVILPILLPVIYADQLLQDVAPPDWVLELAAGVLFMGAFCALNTFWLARDGQTLGKKLLGMRITDLSGQLMPASRVLLLRYLVGAVVGWIPLVGSIFPLLDALFIFRGDQRCIHDLIAGTKVVRLIPSAPKVTLTQADVVPPSVATQKSGG